MITANKVKLLTWTIFFVIALVGCIEENNTENYLMLNGEINALINNGQASEALVLAEKCYEDYKNTKIGVYSASAAIELSSLLSDVDENRSIDLLQEALQIQNSIYGESSSEAAFIHYMIGSMLHFNNSCIEHYKKAIEYTDMRNNGEYAIRSSIRLAQKLKNYNQYDEARQLYEGTLAKITNLDHQYPSIQLDIMSNLVNLYIEIKNFEKAALLQKEVVKIVESKTSSDNSYDIFEIYNDAAYVEDIVGNTDYAINLLQKIDFHISEMTEQEKTAKKIKQLSHLAELYEKKGIYLKSEKCRIEAYNLSLKSYSVLHPVSINLFDLLIASFADQNKYADAIDKINARIRLIKNVQGERNVQLVGLYETLARIYEKLNKYELALANYKECVSIYNSNGVGEIDQNYANVLNSIADLYMYFGNKSEAYSIYNKLISTYQSSYGLDDWRIGKCLWNIANTSTNNNEATTNYERALEIYENNFGEDHPYTINLLSDYINVANKIENKSLVNQLATKRSAIVNKHHLQSM